MPRFTCPHCRTAMEAPLAMLGQVVGCPKCKQPVGLPAPPAALPVPAEHRPTERCWRCGARVPEADMVRRQVKSGGSTGLVGWNPLQLDNWFHVGHYDRVDLCPDCVAKHDEKARQAGALYNLVLAVTIGFALMVLFAVCLGAAFNR